MYNVSNLIRIQSKPFPLYEYRGYHIKKQANKWVIYDPNVFVSGGREILGRDVNLQNAINTITDIITEKRLRG